jgi:hypothetical protein
MPSTPFGQCYILCRAHHYRRRVPSQNANAQNRALKRSTRSVLLLIMLVGTCAIWTGAQDKVEKPPNLLHVHHLGCHIAARITEHVINAKTKEIEDRVLWQVTPSAEYEPPPNGGKPDVWDASKPIFEVPGTIDAVPSEATEACSAWVKRMRVAANEEYKKAGQKK